MAGAHICFCHFSRRKRMIVLLAEDDPKIAKLIISLLGKDGCQVDHAHDGEEALLYCESNAYDVYLIG